MLYNYRGNRYPTPGVRAYAFQPAFALPLYDLDGVGIVPRRQLACTQPTQAFQQFAVPLIGLIGTVAGQIALQGVIGQPGELNG